MIVVRHATDHTAASKPSSAVFPFVQALGGCALATFFVASGFLLYRPFLAARVAGGPRPGLGAYALRRIFRILPAYWAALTITTVWLAQPLVFGSDGWQFYSFTYVYSGHALAGIGPAWSLCIEVAWYAFLPAFVVVAGRLPGRPLRSATAAVAVLGLVGLGTRILFAERSADVGFSPNVV